MARTVRSCVLLLPGARWLARSVARFIGSRPFIPLTFRQHIVNAVIAQVLPENPQAFSVRVPGGSSVRFRLPLDDYLGSRLYYYGYEGSWEASLTRLFPLLIHEKACVFDVGANVGYYTMLAAALLGEGGDVHAFEPQPDVFEVLAESARQNRFTRVHLNRAAVAEHDGEAHLHIPRDPMAQTAASLVYGFQESDRSIQIPVISLSSYCEQHAIDGIDVLKVDAEGYEVHVLRGLGARLWEWKPDIVCEVLPGFESEIQQFFAGSDYLPYHITLRGLVPRAHITGELEERDYLFTCTPPGRALLAGP